MASIFLVVHNFDGGEETVSTTKWWWKSMTSGCLGRGMSHVVYGRIKKMVEWKI